MYLTLQGTDISRTNDAAGCLFTDPHETCVVFDAKTYQNWIF
jgi:hypothetical protein